jgi:NAD(P)H dehydrogenase (quinone)
LEKDFAMKKTASNTNTRIPKILITGATGQVGSKTIDFLLNEKDIEIVAAVRSPEKTAAFSAKGIATVILELDDESTHLPALKGIDRLFLVTAYTVDMLRQSKAVLDNAKKAGVHHVVHLGACGRDDTTVAHWTWHQFVERYIEWSGFSYTHLRPEAFMQNVLSYGGKKTIKDGVINAFVEGARLSWVGVDDLAQVAALALAHPELHGGQTYRLGYDAVSFGEPAELMTAIVGQPFRYEPLSPDVFLEAMRSAGAEMAYMNCVYDHWKRYAAGKIPGADDTFDNFPVLTGKQPTKWADFIQRHKSELAY